MSKPVAQGRVQAAASAASSRRLRCTAQARGRCAGTRLRRKAAAFALLALALAAAPAPRQAATATHTSRRNAEASPQRLSRAACPTHPSASSSSSSAASSGAGGACSSRNASTCGAAAERRCGARSGLRREATRLRSDERFALRQGDAQLLLQAFADGALRGRAQVCSLQHHPQARAQLGVADCRRRVCACASAARRRGRGRRLRITHGSGRASLCAGEPRPISTARVGVDDACTTAAERRPAWRSHASVVTVLQPVCVA